MKIIISILFFWCSLISAILSQDKKWQNAMLYLMGVCLCFRISMSITTPSEYNFVRYTVDYLQVSLLDFFILNFGCLAIFCSRKYKRENNKDLIILLIFLLLHIISYKFAINKVATMMAIIVVIKLIFLYLYFSRIFDIDTQKSFFVGGLSTGVIVQALITIIQKINNGPIGLSILGEELSGFRTREVIGVVSTGMAGTFQHSGALAIYAIFVLSIIVFSHDCLKTFKYYSSIMSCLIIIYLAESRTVLVLSALVLVVFFMKNNDFKIKRKLVLLMFSFVVGGSVFLLIYGQHIVSLFLNSDIESMLSARFSQWQIGFYYIFEHPIRGYGANNFTDTMFTYAPGLFNSIFNYQNPIHNTFIQYWFDLGVFGFVTVIIIQLRNFRFILNQKKKNIEISSLKKGALVFILVSVVYYLSGWSLLNEPLIEMLWICYGLIYNVFIVRIN